MHKLFMLHEPIKCLLVPHLMLIKMIIMLLVFFEIANQIDKSDEMPGNICAGRQQQPAAKPAPVPSPASAHRRRSPTAWLADTLLFQAEAGLLRSPTRADAE